MLHYTFAARSSFRPTDEFSWQLVQDTVVYRRQFIMRLGRYDGSKPAFGIIISETLAHNGLSQNILAEICETTTGSISRWSRGSAPSKLARLGAVERIRTILDSHVQEIERSLSQRPRPQKQSVLRMAGPGRRPAKIARGGAAR
jgi:hypothetical protein